MGSPVDLAIRLGAMGPSDILDILLVSSLIFAVLYFVRGTRAVQLLRGILLMVLLVTFFSRLVRLPTFSSIVRASLPTLLLSIPIIFQPELRRVMERLGRAGRLRGRQGESTVADAMASIVALAAKRLSDAGHGALIVLERDTGLDDLAERGVALNADASVDLLAQLFYPNSPLHDGAVILSDGEVVAARVVLPIRDAPLLDQSLGTRHLAAVSVSESTDALAVVVSEETGKISLAVAGRLLPDLDEGDLSRHLRQHLSQQPSPTGRLIGPLLRVPTLEGIPAWRSYLTPAASDSEPAATDDVVDPRAGGPAAPPVDVPDPLADAADPDTGAVGSANGPGQGQEQPPDSLADGGAAAEGASS